MRRGCSVGVLGLSIVLCSEARASEAPAGGPPSFEDYRAPVTVAPNPTVDLNSHRLGPRFRTRLRAAVQESGVNFAGRFTLASWCCGTACQMFFIIDPTTGKLWHQPECGVARGLEFRPDSRLLILDADPPVKYAPQPTAYYVWTGRDLTLVWPPEEEALARRCSESSRP